MTVDEGIDLAIRGIHAAIKRDAASGNGIDVSFIDKKGYTQLTQEQVGERIKKMDLQG